MSDSEEDVVLKDDDDVFGEQVDLDDFSFISTEAPSNEKDGNIYDQSDNEDEKKQTTSKSQQGKSATPDGKKLKQKKRERSPSPNPYNQKQTPPKDRHRRIQNESDSDDQHEITQNTRPPPPMVTPESEVHVDLDEIKSFQGKKAGFAEMILQTTHTPAPMYYNASIDPSSFNPAHVTSTPASSNYQERYKDYSSKRPQQEMARPASNYVPRPYAPVMRQSPTPQPPMQMHLPSFSQQQPPLPQLPHVQGAPPIPGVALTQQQFDEMYRYKVNTNNNNNHTKPRENKQVREPTLQIANPLAPKVPDEIILEEQKRVELKLEVSKIVVKALTKYLKEGKIANKDDFKHLSRKLTHKIMMKEQGIKHAISEKRTKAIQKFIDNWFRKKGGSYVRKSKPWEKPPSVVNFVPPLHPGM